MPEGRLLLHTLLRGVMIGAEARRIFLQEDEARRVEGHRPAATERRRRRGAAGSGSAEGHLGSTVWSCCSGPARSHCSSVQGKVRSCSSGLPCDSWGRSRRRRSGISRTEVGKRWNGRPWQNLRCCSICRHCVRCTFSPLHLRSHRAGGQGWRVLGGCLGRGRPGLAFWGLLWGGLGLCRRLLCNWCRSRNKRTPGLPWPASRVRLPLPTLDDVRLADEVPQTLWFGFCGLRKVILIPEG
mmetsp:Transcript_25621/g.74060  ORF Transcript_25621/g.74060 Transcript_25621/m.74060 type:complete len:240 (-) Transcript_25621:362-1081(-)